MAIHLPGLAQMLGKVLGKQPEGPKPDAKGLVGQPAAPAAPAAPVKGAPLGATVLHGAGYNFADRTSTLKNVHEKDTVARFLKDPEVDKFLGRSMKEPEEAKALREEKPAEVKDRQDARADVKREEKAEEQKVQVAREAQKEEAQRDQAHEKERERQREEKKKDDEHAQGQWADDEQREDGDEPKPEGLYDADPLGETFRCKGEHEGVRCLRRPMEGTAFCREHLVVTPPVLPNER